MKICRNCGVQADDTNMFCPRCGGPLVPGIHPNGAGIEKRDIAMAIVLTIVTCGIYGFYWMYCLNDEIKQLSGDVESPDGTMVIVFSIITCGIYSLFWYYKMGENCDKIKGGSNTSIIYLVLGIFGMGIVNYCLIQDTINKTIGA